MAEPQLQKKSKKKKRKSTASAGSQPSINCAESASDSITSTLIEKNNCSINEILPQKVGMTTVFKDVEVTMTECTMENTGASGSSSKKKKKKKKSKQAAEAAQEAITNENGNPENLLNFSENHIELVNHPEISVTLSSLLQAKEENEPKKLEGNICENVEKQKEDSSVTTSGSKKKKKKKKKKNQENILPDAPLPEEPAYTAPTYVKLPASGDSCVLVVSHESFSNGNNSLISSDTNKTKATENNVPVQQGKSGEDASPNNAHPYNSNIQIGSSVSIFPVSNDLKTKSSDTMSDFSKGPDLDKISSIVKNEIKAETSAETVVCNSENDIQLNTEESKLTKAQLKAERRAKQEAQRAAKLAKNAEKVSQTPLMSDQNKNVSYAKDASLNKINDSTLNCTETTSEKSTMKSSIEKETLRRMRLFSHLPQCKQSYINTNQFSEVNSKIHPSILEIGSQYSKGIICGSNARCIALLGAFRDVIKDYSTPPDKVFSRDLESKLQTYLNFLSNCRPLSVSMINAVKFLKHHINHTPDNIEEETAKERLCKYICNFVREEILLAKEAIGNAASAKIVEGDTILVFAYSSVVNDVLCKAYNQNKQFKVVIVDSRPKNEGLEMLRSLVKQGICCSYLSISAVSYVMKEVSKVIIGAHALLSNGCVMSRLGCKQIALVASSYSVPVLVCCETYKFCERALTDSFVHNEIGEPEDLISTSPVQNDSLQNWKSLPSLQLLNLLYDVTPPDLISMVITEKGVLPCTSVPVVLRVRHAGLHE